jgi:hypothetical protein
MASSYEKWYSLSEDKFDSIKVKNVRFETWLRTNYKSSLSRALISNFPGIRWEPWRFANVSPGFWDGALLIHSSNFCAKLTLCGLDKQNQAQFLQWAAKKLGLASLDGWYRVSLAEFTKIEGGSSLIAKYSSLPDALGSVFSDHSWEVWKFSASMASSSSDILSKPQDATANHATTPGQAAAAIAETPPPASPAAALSPRQQRESDTHYAIRGFMSDIGKKLGVQQLDDWYRVSYSQLAEAGASHILVHYGGLPGILKILYPGHRWNQKVFTLAAKRAVQRQLRIRLETLFPGQEVIEEYNVGLKYLRKEKYIGFDAYVPALKLAFEYQGEVHFRDIQSVGQRDIKRDNDAEKAAVCARQGIKLVEVPFTWGSSDRLRSAFHPLTNRHITDSEEASLVSLIKQVVPDLLNDWQPKIERFRG